MYCDSLFHFSVTKRFHRNGGFDMLLTENKEGFVVIDDSVLVSIVSNAANECFGVAGMTAKNVTEGFLGLFRKDSHDK